MRVGEVGFSGGGSARRLADSPGGVPRWEAFPEVNRALVACLLGLLVERMVAPVAVGDGGERDERAGQAVRAAGG